MSIDLSSLTRKFIYNIQEGKGEDIGVREYLQALGETLNSFNPRTQTEQIRLEFAKEQLSHIKKQTRRLQEKIAILEEQVSFLEEDKDI